MRTRATSAPELLAVGETMAMVTPASAEPLADASDFRLEAGGAESNVATHVAALGHSAAWAGRLGHDPLGHRIARQLAAQHVDVSRVEFDPRHPTGVYFKDPGSTVRYYRAGSAASHMVPSDADALDLTACASCISRASPRRSLPHRRSSSTG